MPNTGKLTTKVLTAVLVRCWSDPGNDVLVEIKSYSVYEAADDARNEYPGYAYYDPVRVLRGAGYQPPLQAETPVSRHGASGSGERS